MDRGSFMVVRVSTVTGAVLAAVALNLGVAAYSVGVLGFAVALLILWSGIALRWWSFRTLGRYFTFRVMTSTDQPVITSGPYRMLRHPSYLGILLALLGIGLMYGNWISVASLVVLPFIGFMNRIRVEEAALRATLGDRYTSYALGRKRLIPLVW
jgi:protein-S-isoprenylcysteine O-methyltransferase Ste14